MRITKTHPLGRDITVSLDGEPLTFCLMADDREGVAEVAVLDADGKPRWEDGRTLTELRRGYVQFAPKPGREQEFTWFCMGWISGWEEAEARGEGWAAARHIYRAGRDMLGEPVRSTWSGHLIAQYPRLKEE